MIKKYLNYTPTVDSSCYVAEGAYIIGNVTIKKNSSIWFNSVIRGDENYIAIGENTNIQDLVMVHTDDKHPAIIGDDVTIGHHAIIHGCTIGNNSLIGINATVLDNAKIGNNCIIGANSLVTSNKIIPDNSLVFGNPAKVIRELTEDEIKGIKQNADIYTHLAENYLNE